jgi:hypothetical protein
VGNPSSVGMYSPPLLEPSRALLLFADSLSDLDRAARTSDRISAISSASRPKSSESLPQPHPGKERRKRREGQSASAECPPGGRLTLFSVNDTLYQSKGRCTTAMPHCIGAMLRCSTTMAHCTTAKLRCTSAISHFTVAMLRCTSAMFHCIVAILHCSATKLHCSDAMRDCSDTKLRCIVTTAHCSAAMLHCIAAMPRCTGSTRLGPVAVSLFERTTKKEGAAEATPSRTTDGRQTTAGSRRGGPWARSRTASC